MASIGGAERQRAQQPGPAQAGRPPGDGAGAGHAGPTGEPPIGAEDGQVGPVRAGHRHLSSRAEKLRTLPGAQGCCRHYHGGRGQAGPEGQAVVGSVAGEPAQGHQAHRGRHGHGQAGTRQKAGRCRPCVPGRPCGAWRRKGHPGQPETLADPMVAAASSAVERARLRAAAPLAANRLPPVRPRYSPTETISTLSVPLGAS